VMLEKWGLAPSEIPAGEFMRYLRKLGFDDNPASPPDPQASPRDPARFTVDCTSRSAGAASVAGNAVSVPGAFS